MRNCKRCTLLTTDKGGFIEGEEEKAIQITIPGTDRLRDDYIRCGLCGRYIFPELKQYSEVKMKQDKQYSEVKMKQDKQYEYVKPKVALDVDGVLADFYLAACRIFEKPLIKTDWDLDWMTKERMQTLHDSPQFWATLPVLNPPECLNFDFECYITSIDPRNLEARRTWLTFNGFPEKPVYASSKKIELCEELGITHLVDDSPHWKSSDKVEVIRYFPSYLKFPDVSNRKRDGRRTTLTHLSELYKFIPGLKNDSC